MNTLTPRKISLLAAASLFLVQVPAAFAAAAASRASFSGNSVLFVDGVSCGQVQQWQGGEVVGDAVVERSGDGTPPKKHIGAIHITPIIVELSAPPAAPLVELMNALFTNTTLRKTITVADYPSDTKLTGTQLEATNASLIEVDFAAVDAASKDPYQITLVFSAESVRTDAAKTAAPSAGGKGVATKRVVASNFKFALGELASDRVMSVAAFTVKRAVTDTSSGETRDYKTESGPVTFANLVVTLSEMGSADWTAWQDDFIVKGNNGDSREKTGRLDLLDATLKEKLFSLQFSHVGITRLTHEPMAAGKEGVAKLQAELYYEGLSVVPPGSAGVASGATGTKTGETKGATPEDTKTPEKKTSTTTDPAKETKDAAASDPSEKSPAATTATGTTPAVSPGGSADDQGVRDPADFPRVGSLTRKTSISVRQPASSDETATYSSKLSLDELASTYESTLKTAGWEQTMRNESGDPTVASHQYRERWTKALQGVELRLTQAKTGASEVSVDVTSNRAGSLSTVPATKATSPGSAPAGGSASDQGARDPADFPRVAGSVRKSYTAIGSSAAPQEMVSYSAKPAIDQVEAFFLTMLAKDEWTESYRRETGDPAAGSHQITMNWSKGRRTAAIVLTEGASGLTQIGATVITPAAR